MSQRMPMNTPNAPTVDVVWVPNRGPKYVHCICTRRFNIKAVRACPYCGAEYNSRVMKAMRSGR